MAVVPDDDHGCISEDEDPQPIRSITPPTPLSPSYPQTEVILMCMEHFWMIRYMNMSYSAVSAHFTSIISIKQIISIMSIISSN